MRKIRVAQIGTSANSHGNDVFANMLQQSDLFDVVGYAMPEREPERFPARMQRFEGHREMSVEEILQDPTIEAVTVETEELYLTKYALMAAEHGKHIHMEKPGGCDPVLFEKLIRTVEKNGTVFHTGYMYRYNPMVQQLMEEIRRGDFGEIISVEAQMNCIHNPEVRNWLGQYPGGMMFYLGCHLVDLILQIQGEPDSIIPLNRRSGLNGCAGEDFGMAVFTYDRGVSFAKTSAVEIGGYARRQLVVSGTKKTVELKPFERSAGVPGPVLFTESTTYTANSWADNGTTVRSENYNRYTAMMAGFAAMCRGDRQNPWTPAYELSLFRAVLRACGAQIG